MNKSELLRTYIVPAFFPILTVVDGIIIRFARLFSRRNVANDVIFIRTDNLGDFILWLAAATALRRQWPWPGRRFVLIANQNWFDLALSLQLFDEIIPIDRKKFQRNIGYRFVSLSRLARRRAELLINPIHGRDPLSSDTIARAVGATRKLAARGDTSNALGQDVRANQWYNKLISSSDVAAHEAIKNREFLARLCRIDLPEPWPKMRAPELRCRSTELPNGRYVVIAPGAEASLRVWPIDRFAYLAERLARETGLQVVLTGSAAERPIADKLESLLSFPVLNLTGKFTLRDILAILEKAQLIVTNETGTAHLGAAFRVPTVCIAGGGHFKRFVPYPKDAERAGIKLFPVYYEMPCFGCDWRCIYHPRRGYPAPCISNIKTESAWSAVKAALDCAPID